MIDTGLLCLVWFLALIFSLVFIVLSIMMLFYHNYFIKSTVYVTYAFTFVLLFLLSWTTNLLSYQ
jgi:hypothetical protein